MTRLEGKHHNIFNNSDILMRLEGLLKKQKPKFQELQINNLVELVRYCGVNELHIGPTMVGIAQMDKREGLHRIFDPHTEKRKMLEEMLHRARVQKRGITHETSLSGLTLNTIAELTSQVQDLDSMITDLESKLNSLPARNGVSDQIFNSLSFDELVEKRLVHRSGFLSSRGEKVISAAQDGFSILKGQAEFKERASDERLLELYTNVKKAMKKRLTI